MELLIPQKNMNNIKPKKFLWENINLQSNDLFKLKRIFIILINVEFSNGWAFVQIISIHDNSNDSLVMIKFLLNTFEISSVYHYFRLFWTRVFAKIERDRIWEITKSWMIFFLMDKMDFYFQRIYLKGGGGNFSVYRFSRHPAYCSLFS